MTGTAARFADRDDLVDALRSQKIVRGDREVARALADAGELLTFEPGEEIMRQGDSGNDCFFLLAGAVDLKVKGETLPYGRTAGEVVGEFAAINPKLPRTATVVAREQVVAMRCTAPALKAAGRKEPEIWRLLAIELTHKVEQRNQLISVTNERPRIFMIAAENRREIAEMLRLELSRDFDVEVWSEEDLVPPGGYELDVLHQKARGADFGIVLAHPDDLGAPRSRKTEQEWETIRFELGYLMSELSRHRTLVMIPDGEGDETPRLFKGIQPMTYQLPASGMPLQVALTRAVEEIRTLVSERKVRSRLRSPE